MTRFVRITAVSPIRRFLAILVSALTLAGIGYVAADPADALSFGPGSSSPAGGICFSYGCPQGDGDGGGGYSATSLEWVPAAAILAVVGFGSAGILAGLRRSRREVSPAVLPQAWH